MFVKILNGFNLLLSTISAIMCMFIAFYFDTTLKIKLFSGVVLVLALLLVIGNIVYLVEVNIDE